MIIDSNFEKAFDALAPGWQLRGTDRIVGYSVDTPAWTPAHGCAAATILADTARSGIELPMGAARRERFSKYRFLRALGMTHSEIRTSHGDNYDDIINEQLLACGSFHITTSGGLVLPNKGALGLIHANWSDAIARELIASSAALRDKLTKEKETLDNFRSIAWDCKARARKIRNDVLMAHGLYVETSQETREREAAEREAVRSERRQLDAFLKAESGWGAWA